MSVETSEIVTSNVISGLRPHDIAIKSTAAFSNGGLERKHRLTAEIVSPDGLREVSLIERGFDGSSDDYIKNWLLFKSAGLPVVPTLRKSSRDTILMTDLTADGSRMYGKGFLVENKEQLESRTYPDVSHDETFLDLTSKRNFTTIASKADDLANQANENKIQLPYDDPFELIVHPDKTWELMTVDLRKAKEFTQSDSNPHLTQEMEQLNKTYAREFLEYLKEAHNLLSKNSPQSRVRDILGKIRRN